MSERSIRDSKLRLKLGANKINIPVIQYVTRGRINRMLKYFKNKQVSIRFEYENSLGHHWVRNYNGKYDHFKITEVDIGGMSEYNFLLFKNGKCVFEQDFPPCSEFTGLGSIRYCNSGPYCLFSIKKSGYFSRIIEALKRN